MFFAFAGSGGYLARNALVTLNEMIMGLALGSTAGVLLALLVARFPRIERYVMPVIVTTQTLPVFAIAPLLVIWFGFGAGSKVVMASLIIFFPVASSFHDGLRGTAAEYLDLARGWVRALADIVQGREFRQPCHRLPAVFALQQYWLRLVQWSANGREPRQGWAM
ncbi:MAG: ABC transporter permease subunit [Nitratireductor sp.]